MSEVTKFFSIDTETMSTDVFGKILSVSVCFFDINAEAKNLDQIFSDNDVFHMNFDLGHQDAFGLVTDPNTYEWWKKIISNEQNAEARKRLIREIHNGKSTFQDFVTSFEAWLRTKVNKGEEYYVFERQLGFDRERFNMFYRKTTGDKPAMEFWRFADTRTWIRKSKLSNAFAIKDAWTEDCVKRLFQDFPYVKHHSVDDAILDGFMIKLLVQNKITEL